MGLVQSMAILRFDLSWAFRRRCAFCTLWTVGFVVLSDMSICWWCVDGEEEFVVGRWVVERESDVVRVSSHTTTNGIQRNSSEVKQA
jgi:hypothetical protein